MEWTKDKPASIGWYWYQPGTGEVEILEVVVPFYGADDRPLMVVGDRNYFEDFPGYWCGPLEPPPFPIEQ